MSKIQYNLILEKNPHPIFIGLDECGTGSWAGPVVVCGVKAKRDWNWIGLNDSKKLSAKKRESAREHLASLAELNVIQHHIAVIPNDQLDNVGVAIALKQAYADCIKALMEPEAGIFVDGVLNLNGFVSHPVTTIVKGDGIVPAIMAASILAKTFRDSLMAEHHKEYPHYDWVNNMGYGTPKHSAGLKEFGVCKLHRFSYEPMKSMIKS